jgi:ribulose-phosphate 3-epimerase
MSLIVPAVLPSSLDDLTKKLALFAKLPSISRVQIDVVDGKFAAPASWPYTAPSELRALAERGEMLPSIDRIAYEIDFMCLNAEQAPEAWFAIGPSRFTFHAESALDLTRLIETVSGRYGNDFLTCDLIAIGLALNVSSDLALIEPYLDKIDYVQFMGIARIGQQGQPFDRRVLEKVRLFHARHPNIPVQVDGGVSLETAKELVALGVSNLIAGSAILKAEDPAAEIRKFEALRSSFGV